MGKQSVKELRTANEICMDIVESARARSELSVLAYEQTSSGDDVKLTYICCTPGSTFGLVVTVALVAVAQPRANLCLARNIL